MARIRTAVVEVLGNPRFRLAAVCTRDQAKLGWLRGEPAVDHEPGWYQAHRAALLNRARAHPELAQVKLTTEFDGVLAMPDVDAVILTVPIHLNAPFAIRALQAGKHCF